MNIFVCPPLQLALGMVKDLTEQKKALVRLEEDESCGAFDPGRGLAWIRGEVFRRFKLYSGSSEAADFKGFQKQSGHQLWSCATTVKDKNCFRCMVSVEAKVEFSGCNVEEQVRAEAMKASQK